VVHNFYEYNCAFNENSDIKTNAIQQVRILSDKFEIPTNTIIYYILTAAAAAVVVFIRLLKYCNIFLERELFRVWFFSDLVSCATIVSRAHILYDVLRVHNK